MQIRNLFYLNELARKCIFFKQINTTQTLSFQSLCFGYTHLNTDFLLSFLQFINILVLVSKLHFFDTFGSFFYVFDAFGKLIHVVCKFTHFVKFTKESNVVQLLFFDLIPLGQIFNYFVK
jgi:hypothetical protein